MGTVMVTADLDMFGPGGQRVNDYVNSILDCIPIRNQDDGVTDDCGVSVDSHPEVVGADGMGTLAQRKRVGMITNAAVIFRSSLKHAAIGDSRPRPIRVR